MSRVIFRLPDLGEGLVSAEIVAWHVKPGDQVKEDQAVVEMSTDKAVVEVPASVSGVVVSIAGQPGDVIAVGAELIVFETDSAPTSVVAAPAVRNDANAGAVVQRAAATAAEVVSATRVMASPATRRRAREAGIDLAAVAGSGPGGRIIAADLSAPQSLVKPPVTTAVNDVAAPDDIEQIKVIGLRRIIAQRMVETMRNIPHFSYVEEVDVTELEALRVHMNGSLAAGSAPLTFLPFIIAALVRVLREFPQVNAHYDSERNLILRHRAVHVGVATQTPDGLKVPVVRNAQLRGLHEIAAEARRVAAAARDNSASRSELTGSTITVTSLGKLGGIASTPIINAPEVAIIGVNRAAERPVVLEGQITIRRMMNLSSSFDHRFVDGFDAAAMIQALKGRLEHPTTIFIDY